MRKPKPTQFTDYRQLQQIIAGLGEGVILIINQRIVWANEAALDMHGIANIAELGGNVTAYCKRFGVRYRDKHPLALGKYPIERVVARTGSGVARPYS